MTSAAEPRHRFVEANRLKLHLLEWGSGERVVLLVHGYLEHAYTWSLVAPHLAAAGLHVFALDWRGHGDSDWVGVGGYYHFLDYVADLSFLVPQLGHRVGLVGHSMGGGAALLYAGSEPERVAALVSIEGLGVPDTDPTEVPARVVDWLGDLRRATARAHSAGSSEQIAARLQAAWSKLPREAAHLLADNNVHEVDGQRRWKFDPLHRTRSPQPTYAVQARAFWQRITCPVLYLEGSESTLRLPPNDVDERVCVLRASRQTFAGCAHHPHLEQPQATAQAILDFIAPLV